MKVKMKHIHSSSGVAPNYQTAPDHVLKLNREFCENVGLPFKVLPPGDFAHLVSWSSSEVIRISDEKFTMGTWDFSIKPGLKGAVSDVKLQVYFQRNPLFGFCTVMELTLDVHHPGVPSHCAKNEILNSFVSYLKHKLNSSYLQVEYDVEDAARERSLLLDQNWWETDSGWCQRYWEREMTVARSVKNSEEKQQIAENIQQLLDIARDGCEHYKAYWVEEDWYEPEHTANYKRWYFDETPIIAKLISAIQQSVFKAFGSTYSQEYFEALNEEQKNYLCNYGFMRTYLEGGDEKMHQYFDEINKAMHVKYGHKTN